MKKVKTVLAKGMASLILTYLDEGDVTLNSGPDTCRYLFILIANYGNKVVRSPE